MQQKIFAAFSLSITQGIGLIALGNPDTMDMVVAESLKKGVLAQSIEVLDPSEKDQDYSASKVKNHVVLIGPVGGSWKVYGPFEDQGIADEFADSNSEDTDFVVVSVER
jgi:hypothetical protein